MRFDFAELFAVCDLHATRMDSSGWELRPMFYDRQGFPIPAQIVEYGIVVPPEIGWAKLKEDIEYSRVAYDELPDGSYLSTVWLGIDHGWGRRVLIFETMRFAGELKTETEQHEFSYHESMDFPSPYDDSMGDTLRYQTEEEALAAHHEIVRRIRLREGH